MNSYTKLKDGTWGIRCDGSMKEGSTVTVTTKAGAAKTETIAKVLWTGKDTKTGKLVSLCSIQQTARRETGGQGYSKRDGGSRGYKPCYMCGSWYCEGARGGLCEDD